MCNEGLTISFLGGRGLPPPSLTGMVVLGRLLPVEIEAWSVLPLRPLDAYLNHRNPGSRCSGEWPSLL